MAAAVALSNYLVQFPVGWIGTWGTAVFPVCFLITDLTNRFAGAAAARRVVYAGFAVGVPASFLVLPDEPRIAARSESWRWFEPVLLHVSNSSASARGR